MPKKEQYEKTWKVLSKRVPSRPVDPREALMDAVVRLTAREGIENVSVRTIVAEAEGIGTDTFLYRLFGGKEKLLSDTFLREDKRLVYEVERRSTVLWEANLPFESRMRYLWNMIWHWLTDRHTQECLFLTRYYYCAFCDEDTLKAHQTIWDPLAEKWQDVFPHADTTRLAEIFFSTILAMAFPVCQGRSPNDGTAAENGFRTLAGVFAFWAESAGASQSVRASI